MINSQYIERKWFSIDVANISGFRYVRLTKECKPELNIGFNSISIRCLILELPLNFSINIIPVVKENLSIQYIQKSNCIVIELLNINYKDLFNDLVLSIYHKVKDMILVQEYAKEFVLTFEKWIEFFENKRNIKLSEEQIQGLYGELFVLQKYLKDSNPSNINSILSSWKGLYDSTNDFVFDLKNVEVKTKNESKPYVKISSEFQLETEFDKGLELLVVTVKIDLLEGKSIQDMLLIIIKQIRDNHGDLSILYHALNQKGLTVKNLEQYNNYRFVVLRTELFDAASDDFPKLSKSNIVNDISSLKYKLRVTQLEKFFIELKKY